MKKICKIKNGRFAWILEVDGVSISFQGRDAAEYFQKHYEELGYDVV